MITVDDQPVPWEPGMSISDLLETLDHVEFCSVVRLNGKLVSSPAFDETRIPDESVVQLLPIVAGG